jgi:hypothetical protein
MALLRHDAGGSEAALTGEPQPQLVAYVQTHRCLTARQVAHHVQPTWQVTYRESDIPQLLHRLGFVYKKPKLSPGQANAERQRAFVEACRKLQATKKPQDRLYFMDATHPHPHPIAGYGWLKRGQTPAMRSHTGRQRLNINGVIDGHALSAIVRYDATLNAHSTIPLFQRIEAKNPGAGRTIAWAITPVITMLNW